MTVSCATVTLHIPWADSLKDKRSVVKGLLAKLHAKFNISAAEVEGQDTHRTAVLGLACVSGDARHAAAVIDSAVEYIEPASGAVITDILRETR